MLLNILQNNRLNFKRLIFPLLVIALYAGNGLAKDDTLHVDYPGDEIQIGDIFSCYVTLKVGDSVLTELAEKITWSFIESGGNHDSTILNKTGAQVRFEPTEAPSAVIIWGIYYDEGYGLYVSVVITVDVIPGVADHVVIEASYKLEDSHPNDDNPLDSIFIDQKETSNDQFYAILRDKYGNWLGPADSVRWSSVDDSIATAAQGPNPQLGQGKATRATFEQRASTNITATSTHGFTDDIKVGIASLPPATLIANPGDTMFTTYSLDIILTTNAERIYYTVDGSDPDTNNPSQLYTGPVTVIGNVTLKAIAVGPDHVPTSDSWTYVCNLPYATLIADPGDSTIYRTESLDIILTTNAEKIYYTLDGSEPDTTNPAQLYTGPITISSDEVTVRAIAVGLDYLPTSDSWSYYRVLPATITAIPGDGTTFGLTLDVELITNSDQIYYTMDGSSPDSTNTSRLLYTGPITIPADSPDTVILRAITVGEYYSPTTGSWTYYREYLPEITALPEGMEFEKSIEVQLVIDHVTAKIYYTIDGSVPDTNSASTFLYTGNPIKITSTTELKAIAYAPDIMPSPELLEIYTRIFVVKSALYKDTNGDGRIDMAELVFDEPPEGLPASVELRSPFDNTEKDTVYSDGISWLNGVPSTLTVTIMLNTPFSEDQNTGFEDGYYGTILEGLYANDAFQIGDGVAPVINSATYCPGEIIDVKTLDRAFDTLIVIFAEDVEDIDFIEPFVFKTEYGTEYSFKLHQMSLSGNKAIFEVESEDNVEYPYTEDSIKIYYKAGVSDTRDNDQDIKDNRYVKLEVKPKPYRLIVTVEGPDDPAACDVPEVLATNPERGEITIKKGVFIIIDFLTNLMIEDDSQIHKLQCYISIFDQVGNLVEQCMSIEEENEHLQIAVLGNSNQLGKSSTKIVICWTGQNQNGRQVGQGMYMADIHLTDHHSTQRTIQRLIGVRK